MIQKIGKYRILERIGRGGMGTVLKAHDPVLDRTVALKVISSEIEVTDELRARFFREAQACARLSHPNIITVYDLADIDGHLFIVMEFLEGDELKQIIAQRRALALEAKLALMIQVCSGLEYAHQRGIVHRDIKPGNIFVLGSGDVKILDFGIARIVTAEAGLTRTGLIMGTLRYMAPEQARGRADQRSDIFSVGSVFYELLAYRPAFPGEDPMEILEQLRSEDPPPLTRVDPSLPSELADIIARALRKDPAARFPELGEMRRQLEAVRRRLLEEAESLRAGLRVRLQQARKLQAALAERVGGSPDDGTLPIIDDAGGVAALRALEQQFAHKIESLQALLERAAVLDPAIARAVALMGASDYEAATAMLAPIVEEFPQHARAQAALRDARAGLAQERQRQEAAARLLAEARALYAAKAFDGCLEMLQQRPSPPRPDDLEAELAALEEAARNALAAQEAQARRAETLRREREAAERQRERAAQARREAEAARAAHESASLWSIAEQAVLDGDGALKAQSHAAALEQFEAAVELYERAATEARDAVRRRARRETDEARSHAARARGDAADAGAAVHAAELWTLATGKDARANATLEGGDFTTAVTLFLEARRDYEGAADTARRAIARHERDDATRARERAEHARRAAGEARPQEHARSAWEAAETKRAEADTAFGAEAYREAVQEFDAAAELYRRADVAARTAVRDRSRQTAEAARQTAATARRNAEEARAASYVHEAWASAAMKETQATEALGREEYTTAATLFADVRRAYDEASTMARAERLKRERESSERGRESMERARRAADQLGARRHASARWSAADAKRVEAEAAFAASEFPIAVEQFEEAVDLYHRAATEARAAIEAMERARTDAAEARGHTETARRRAGDAAAPSYAAAVWQTAGTREAEANAAFDAEEYGVALLRFRDARDDYARAAEIARAGREEEVRRADRLAGEATRSLEAGRHADALGRADEALAIVPDHPAAERLRALADAGMREAEERRAATDRLVGDGETRLRAGDLEGAIDVFRAALARDSLHVRAVQLLEDAQTRLEARREAERVQRARREAERVERERREAARIAEERRDAERVVREARETARRRREQVPADATVYAPARDDTPLPRRDETARTRSAPRRVAAVAAVMVVAVGITAYLARGWFSPPPTPPARELDVRRDTETSAELAAVRALAREVATARAAAVAAGADRLAPKPFEAATASTALGDKAAETNATEAKARYGEALEGFRQARTEAEQAALRNQKSEEAQRAREQALSARGVATAAGAAKEAAAVWKRAADTQQRADRALKEEDFDAARALFTEAGSSYREAANVAAARASADRAAMAAAREREEAELAAQRRRELEEVRKAALAQRERAIKAGGETLAKEMFDAATTKSNEADALGRGGNLLAAIEGYRGATVRYGAAERRAKEIADAERRGKEVSHGRTEADAAKSRREQALRVGADVLAKDLFEAASSKLSEADKLSRAENWAAAARSYTDAATGYGEAERRAKDIAEVRAQAEATKVRREGAAGAGAETYAKDVFEAAAAKHNEADRLARGANVVAALPVYRDAGERYADAEKKAKAATASRGLADVARDRMVAEKRRGRPESPEYAQAVAQEKQANTAYQRNAFVEASDAFRAAAEHFTRSAAAPPGADPRDEIKSVLNDYSRAFETKDGGLLQRVRPGLRPEEMRRYNDIWEMVNTFKVVLKVEQIDVSGDEAQVKGRREDVLIMKDGRRERGAGERPFTFKMKRGRTGWTIDTVN